MEVASAHYVESGITSWCQRTEGQALDLRQEKTGSAVRNAGI